MPIRAVPVFRRVPGSRPSGILATWTWCLGGVETGEKPAIIGDVFPSIDPFFPSETRPRGRVSADSTVTWTAAIFIITISGAAAREAIAMSEKPTKTVLVIEDNSITSSGLAAVLGCRGYAATVAPD